MSPGIKSRLLATQSDERLAALVHAGHEPAFEALVHRYRKPLLRYCRRLCLSDARAEEALQQTLMNAWVALRRDGEVREVGAWLYRIAHNAAINALRAERVTLASSLSVGELHGTEHATAITTVSSPSLDQVLALRDALTGMAELPTMQREVIVRTAVGGHSHTEVASALGITADAVRGLLYRARASLRDGLTAITPAPLLAWAAETGRAPAAGGQRMAELAAGGGTAGLTGLAIKGAAVAITAGVAISGAVIAHDQAGYGHPSRLATAGSDAGLVPAVGGGAQDDFGRLLAMAAGPLATVAAGARGEAERGQAAALNAPTASSPSSRTRVGRSAPSRLQPESTTPPPGLNGGAAQSQGEQSSARGGSRGHEPTGVQSSAGGSGATGSAAGGRAGEEHGGRQSHGQGAGQGGEEGSGQGGEEGSGQGGEEGSGQGGEQGAGNRQESQQRVGQQSGAGGQGLGEGSAKGEEGSRQPGGQEAGRRDGGQEPQQGAGHA